MNTEVYKVGAVLDSSTSKTEQQNILALLDQGKNVILDLTECTYVSSAGLRVMLYAYKVAASSKLQVLLVGVSDEVRDVMKITGFAQFFKYFDTVEDCKQQIG